MASFSDRCSTYSNKDILGEPAVRSNELATLSGTDCFLATSMVTSGLQVKKNDIVINVGVPYEVHGCTSVAGALAVVGLPLSFVCHVTQTASKLRQSSTSSEVKCVVGHSVRYAVAWFTEADAYVIHSL